MANSPIIPQSKYVTPVAVGFADGQGALSIVGSDVPLPVSTVRNAPTPAPMSGSSSTSIIAGPYAPITDTPIHLQLSGTWTGSVALQRSIDGGVTRQGLTVGGAPWAQFTANANEAVWQEGEAAATFYLAITIASGTLTYRVSQ
ncbi:hypothetical protein [Novosphingobium kaempferiae]|uniref:hypothetical protein n=1 Tax=Novosphingobium kaempferiae TaxID=2896849 RepID=UPI001E4088B3|nr:hypothetical protein [Novosphingobium kaempferiae]